MTKIGRFSWIEDPAHIFECIHPPTCPEDGPKYRHPVMPLCVDENGRIYTDDPDWLLSETSTGNMQVTGTGWDKEEWCNLWGRKPSAKGVTVRLPLRSQIVYECYHNKVLECAKIYRWNFNPYDNRKCNLFATQDIGDMGKFRRQYYKKRYEFVEASVRQINARILKVIEKGGDPFKYLEFLQLPKWLYKEWEITKESFGLQPGILDHYRNL